MARAKAELESPQIPKSLKNISMRACAVKVFNTIVTIAA
jgi:hypothetical protein